MGHEDDRDTRVRVARERARLLHDHRERKGPPPDAVDASWLALTRRIAAGEPGPLDEEEARPRPEHPGAPAWRRWVLGAVAVAAALTLWQLAPRLAGRSDGTAGHAANLQQIDPAEPRSASSHADVPGDRRDGPPGQVLRNMLQRTDGDSAPDLEAPRTDPGANEPGAPGPGAQAVPGSRRATDKASVPGDSQEATTGSPTAAAGAADLGRELALLRAAAEALRAGQGAQALAHAEDYLERHPAGVFVPEARLHRAEALCLLGRAEDARAASAAFLRELPESPLGARIAAVCAR